MSDTGSTMTAPAPADGHGHASDLLYIKVAAGLAVLTGMEVAWPYIVSDGPILMFPLLIVMAIKFVIIAAFFMHLKFDSKVLSRVFYSGLGLAVGVYVIALLTFRVFEGHI
jgi:cytochrome c oxidase subunit IV